MQRQNAVSSLVATWNASSSLIALVALIAFNLVPIIGVLAWGWSLMLILILYWLENGVIGVINIFKIGTAQGANETSPPRPGTVKVKLPSGATKALIIPFFAVHYGMFWVGHGIFLFALPLFANLGGGFGGPGESFRFGDFGELETGTIAAGVALLSVSHVTSFFVNWIGRREYLGVSPLRQMGSVYGRVVILHVTILGSAFLIGLAGTPLVALVLLVVLKTGLDVWLHLREHRRAAEAVRA